MKLITLYFLGAKLVCLHFDCNLYKLVLGAIAIKQFRRSREQIMLSHGVCSAQRGSVAACRLVNTAALGSMLGIS